MKDKNSTKHLHEKISSTNVGKLLIVMLLFVLSGFYSMGQLPVVEVRFANPNYDCVRNTYCVDVQFRSDTPELRMFSMNVRFWHESAALDFLGFYDLAVGYAKFSPNPPLEDTKEGTPFGFPGASAIHYINGAVQLTNTAADPIYLPTVEDEWVTLFSVCFNVLDPLAFGSDGFCPSLIWDLEEDPSRGGYNVGSDGVTITYLAPPIGYDPIDGTPIYGSSQPFTESVVQFNWTYDGDGDVNTYGYPVPTECIQGDEMPPVVSEDPGSSVVECIDDATLPTPPDATDDCGGYTVTLVSTVDDPDPLVCEGTRIYTFEYSDQAGNTTTWTYTYTIERTTAPAQVGTAATSTTIACLEEAEEPELPEVADVCGNVLTPTAASPHIDADFDGCEGIITYTYAWEDCAGLIYPWTFTYFVEPEDFVIEDPEITNKVSCPDLTDDEPDHPVVTDNCGNILTPTGPVVSEKPLCDGERTYTWTYTDCDGNSHDWVYKYVVLPREEFLVPAGVTTTVACASEAVEPTPPEVTDNCGNILTPADPVQGGTYNGCQGTITYTWTFTDCSGNTQSWVFTYDVNPEPFEITAPDGEATVECVDDAVAPELPVVTDNCGNVLTPVGMDIVSRPEEISCEGTIKYVYSYVDCEQNQDTWTFTYTVERSTPPAEVGGPVEIMALVETLDEAVPPVLPVMQDVCGLTLEPSGSTTETTVDCDGTFIYTYLYEDCAGLTTTWTFTYVLERTTPPAEVGEPVAVSNNAECLDEVTEPDILPVVEDVEGVVLQPTEGSPVINETGNSCDGTVSYTYTYEDCAGLTFSWTYTWYIEDTTEPEIIVPSDLTIQAEEDCTYDASPEETGWASATDNCTVTPTVTYSDAINPGEEPGSKLITRTWTAVDDCGNEASQNQLITVIGAGGLELVLNDYCVFLNDYGKWTLSNWDIAQIIKGTQAACGGSYEFVTKVEPRTFECKDANQENPVVVTVTDIFGNTKSGTINMQVLDTISPVAICRDVEVSLGENGQVFVNAVLVNAGDDRESVPEWAKHYNDLEGGSYDNCGIAEIYLDKQLFKRENVGENIVTMTVVDPSGNVGHCQAVVTVVDPFAVPVEEAVVNKAPTLADISDIQINKEPLSFDVTLGNITPGDESQEIISVTAVSDNAALLTNLQVVYQPGSTTGILVVTVAPGVSGEALVTITVKDNGGTANGGVDTIVKTFKVKVTAGDNIVGITLTDPEGTPIVTDAIDLDSAFGLELYPNPTSGNVNISMTWNEIKDVDVAVYSVLGVEVFRKEFKAGELIGFDLAPFVSGTYMVRMTVEGKSIVRKVILDKR